MGRRVRARGLQGVCRLRALARRDRRSVRVALVALALGLAMLPWPGRAQSTAGGQGFKSSEYYDAPHETQMKSMLEGAQAQLQPNGRLLVTQAKWRTFRVNGESELAVEAPECLYDKDQGSISSSGPLRVQTGDGQFSIEGEGFLYQQTNSILLVSNRVHTIIHPELLGPSSATLLTNTPGKATPAIDIFSDQFEYAQQSGQGIYQGNVRVAGTNLAATASRLTILLPVAERRLQSLTAEQKAIELKRVELEQLQANTIAAGQDLPPEPPPPPPLPPELKKVPVLGPGDSLATMAAMYGLPESAIKAANPKIDFRRLKPGMSITKKGVKP